MKQYLNLVVKDCGIYFKDNFYSFSSFQMVSRVFEITKDEDRFIGVQYKRIGFKFYITLNNSEKIDLSFFVTRRKYKYKTKKFLIFSYECSQESIEYQNLFEDWFEEVNEYREQAKIIHDLIMDKFFEWNKKNNCCV